MVKMKHEGIEQIQISRKPVLDKFLTPPLTGKASDGTEQLRQMQRCTYSVQTNRISLYIHQRFVEKGKFLKRKSKLLCTCPSFRFQCVCVCVNVDTQHVANHKLFPGPQTHHRSDIILQKVQQVPIRKCPPHNQITVRRRQSGFHLLSLSHLSPTLETF